MRPTDFQYLLRALRLVVFSSRPMTLAEVAEAVIIEPEIQEIDEDARLQTPQDLLDIGGSLFAPQMNTEYDEQHLELSHYSVKEYLLSERAAKGPGAAFALDETQAEIDNTTCCLTYLGLGVFEDLWRDFDSKTWDQTVHFDTVSVEQSLIRQHMRLHSQYPFLEYAAKHCFRHCRRENVQAAVAPLIRKTLSGERSGRFRNMTYTCAFKLGAASDSSYERVFRYSLISVAARYGLAVVVQDLLNNGTPADYITPKPPWIDKYPEGQTALCRAADFGYESLCKVLIDAGASVQGTTDTDCPLSAAARSGIPSIVQMMLDAGADVEKDAEPLAETLLGIWWRYAEGGPKWGDVLNVLRDAGAKWSTVGLLAAFSKTTMPLAKQAAIALVDESNPNWSVSDRLEYVIDDMETNALDALQWLVQDNDGIQGLKASLETLLCAVYDSQPHLFALDAARFATQKFSAEEVIAENLIHIYFRPVSSPRPKTSGHGPPHYDMLNATWTNVSTKASRKTETIDKSFAEPQPGAWEAEGLIVCGGILRAWIQARWDSSYSHFFG